MDKMVSTDQPPLLVVFDFDHTLINANSDLVPFNELPYGKALVPQFAILRKEHGMAWTQTMQNQLANLATQEGYSKVDMVACLRDVKMDPTLIRALKALRDSTSPAVKMVIASDANTVFIEEILSANGLSKDIFAAIYTNSGSWSDSDVLQVSPYQPADVAHGCPRLCPANMCKTTILKKTVEELGLEHIANLQTVYVGDGGNDYCPSLSLKEGDRVFVREGFALQKLIDKELVAKPVEESNTGPPAVEQPTEQLQASATDVVQTSEHVDLPQRVIADVQLWQTHEQLGNMLLALMNVKHPETQKDIGQSTPDTSASTLEQGIAQLMITKDSHI